MRAQPMNFDTMVFIAILVLAYFTSPWLLLLEVFPLATMTDPRP